jgi:hypothetical protein
MVKIKLLLLLLLLLLAQNIHSIFLYKVTAHFLKGQNDEYSSL